MKTFFPIDSKYIIKMSKAFRKDLKRLRQSGYDLQKLQFVVTLLAQDQPLPKQYNNHRLKGDRKNMEECHIAPDWLLIYEKQDDVLILLLIETGTHAQLFKQ